MNSLLLLSLFFLGASLGSFIGAKYYREKKGSGLYGRSHCDGCGRKLTLYENIPVVSYLFLYFQNNAKCKNCQIQIPKEYFLLETLSGLYLVLLFLFLQINNFFNLTDFSLTTYFFIYATISAIFTYFLTLLAYEDNKDREVSAKAVYQFLTLALIFFATKHFFFFDLKEIYLLLILALPFFLISTFFKKSFGQADPLIIAAVLTFFTAINISAGLNTLLYTLWSGGIFSVVYLFVKFGGYKKGVSLPFIPFLWFGSFFLLISNFYVLQVSDILLTWNFLVN
jgi:leader peptidase (prepilin peptidase)/N-methyltransferase